jgi:hypothetical protein
MRNVMAGEQYPLPEWSDLGAYLRDGAKLFVVGLAYFAPVIAVGIVVGIMGTVLAGNRSTEGAGAGLLILFNCLAALYGLAVWTAFPAITGEYVTTGQIGAALRVQEILPLVRDNLGDFLVVFLMGIVASFIGGAGVIACGIGLIFTYPYSAYVMGHLWAQVYQKARGGSLPIVQAPPP